MKYIIYQRVSTDRQEIETQTENCRSYIKSQPIKAETVLFEDPETSAGIKMEKRPGVIAMLASVKKGDLVVIAALDRLSRDVMEMVFICREIRRKGGEFFSLSQGSVPDWQLGIYGAVAQLERENISVRTKSKFICMREREERIGYIPYGYMLKEPIKRTKENKGIAIKLIENPEEQAILEIINEQKERGVSYRALSDFLNHAGLRNRIGNHNKDGKWTHAAVHRVHTSSSKRSLVHSA